MIFDAFCHPVSMLLWNQSYASHGRDFPGLGHDSEFKPVLTYSFIVQNKAPLISGRFVCKEAEENGRDFE